MPAMINAGDGHHSHPTHEYFDQFTFLEQLGWCRDSIHIALIGDLFHGRLPSVMLVSAYWRGEGSQDIPNCGQSPIFVVGGDLISRVVISQ